MSSRKARSLVWVLIALAACSVLARLARDGRSAESLTLRPSGRASVVVEATEFLYRLGFPEPEAMTEEESWEPHPPSCVCHRILEQQLASDCRFGAPVLVGAVDLLLARLHRTGAHSRGDGGPAAGGSNIRVVLRSRGRRKRQGSGSSIVRAGTILASRGDVNSKKS